MRLVSFYFFGPLFRGNVVGQRCVMDDETTNVLAKVHFVERNGKFKLVNSKRRNYKYIPPSFSEKTRVLITG